MCSVCPYQSWLQSPTARDEKNYTAGIPDLCRPALTECTLVSFDWEGARQSLQVLRERGSACATGAFVVAELLKLPLPRPAMRAKVWSGSHLARPPRCHMPNIICICTVDTLIAASSFRCPRLYCIACARGIGSQSNRVDDSEVPVGTMTVIETS